MIPNVTDRNRLPRLGKIRLGEKKVSKSGKEYPAALDHFSLADVPEVQEIYGEKATEISPVLLPHDDEEVFFPTARVAYRQSGLFCKCSDGVTATRVFEPKDEQGAAFIKSTGLAVSEGEMFEMPCPGEDCPYFENKFCKNLGRLMVLLPKVPRFGVYEVATSSWNSMVNVLNVARAVKNLTGGKVSGIPFALVLKPIQVQPDGKAKTVYVLDLEFRGTLLELARRGKALGTGNPLTSLLLPETAGEVPDDLYPNGGESLDAVLNGKASPTLAGSDGTAREAARAAMMPRRTSVAKAATTAVHGKEAPKPADSNGDDEPPPQDDDDGRPFASGAPPLELTAEEDGPGLPEWKGKIKSVESKAGRTNGKDWTLFNIMGDDGHAFISFSESIAAAAAKMVKTEKAVRIVYDDSGRGHKIQEILPA